MSGTRVVPVRDTPDGWAVFEIRGERHVPDYDPEVIGEGMSEQKFRREVLGDWTATEGKLVYPRFGDGHIARDPLPFDPRRPLVCGWDQGGTESGGTPCFQPGQQSATGQLFLWEPVIPPPETRIGIYEFGEWVARYLTEEFCRPAGLELENLKMRHFGDPAGNVKPPKTRLQSDRTEARSCFDIIRLGLEALEQDERGREVVVSRPGWGWRIESSEVSLTKRMDAVSELLKDAAPGGYPAMLVDPGATTLLDALRGGYHYHQRADGRYELDPFKNWYANVANALEYLVSGLVIVAKSQQDDDEGHGYPRSTTRAAGRRR